MLGALSGTSEREWEGEVVLCESESEMSEEENIAAIVGFSGFGKTCKGRSHLTCHVKVTVLMTLDS